ncbi:hypothetical protein FOZ63_016814 [Perkinsus olseni]|uniref:Integrase catalytic domain-containing protein n=1 Tax=Perkinsus olseni TaxID=32597 RepID=A0A7J6ST04_PEROL|nr:hypothetical protein FOZ63_016814 [Perkinsus olseni]
MYHTNPLTGVHRGVGRSLKSARRGGWYFNGMANFFQRLVSTCHICQMAKQSDVLNQQPLRYRRAHQRFTHLQFDFAGPFPVPEHLQESQPDTLRYAAVIIDEATRICMVLPSGGTSAQHVIQALSIWMSSYGVPVQIHMDSPAAHRSSALTKFMDAYHIDHSLGVPRRPESQGLVERLIGELKTSCRLGDKSSAKDGLGMPYWMNLQTAALIHNSSPDADLGMSPMEICLGQDRPFGFMDGLPDESEQEQTRLKSPEDYTEEWNYLHDDIQDRYLLVQAWRNDKAHSKEMASLARLGCPQAFSPGQLVRLTRVVDGHRQLSGPYKIDSKHEKNPFLYKLQGSPHWYNIGQLLRYTYPAEQEHFDEATFPARAYASSMHRTSLPDDLNIELSNLKPGDFVVTFTKEESDDLEPLTTFFISEYLKPGEKSDEVVVLGLDKSSNGRWQRPQVKRREKVTWTVPEARIMGAFKPTRQRRIPQRVLTWLQSIGVL